MDAKGATKALSKELCTTATRQVGRFFARQVCDFNACRFPRLPTKPFIALSLCRLLSYFVRLAVSRVPRSPESSISSPRLEKTYCRLTHSSMLSVKTPSKAGLKGLWHPGPSLTPSEASKILDDRVLLSLPIGYSKA